MGYCSTLAAIRVSDDQVESASQVIDSYPEITHSYLRSDDFNIWFTVIAIDQHRIQQVLDELAIKLDIDKSDVLDLPVKQLFKLDARFKPIK
jgi:DNA-binding Lrp family transcriptional regulator